MEVDSKAVRLFRASAITICPIIFIDPDICGIKRGSILKHEHEHWHQQLLFGVSGVFLGVAVWAFFSWPFQPDTLIVLGLGAIEGWCAGMFLWRWLYLVGLPLGLPVFWNPWRKRWETEAFRAMGYSDAQIKAMLRKAPYFLR